MPKSAKHILALSVPAGRSPASAKLALARELTGAALSSKRQGAPQDLSVFLCGLNDGIADGGWRQKEVAGRELCSGNGNTSRDDAEDGELPIGSGRNWRTD